MVVRGLVIALLLGVGIALIVQNTAPLSVTVLGVVLQPLPLGGLLVAAILGGGVFGLVLQWLLGGTGRSPQAKAARRPPKTKRASKASPSPAAAGVSDWHQPRPSDWYESPQPDQDWAAPDAAFAEDRPRSRWSGLFDTEDEPPYPQKATERDRVVDADYRVLRPPTRPLTDPEWEDDFFEERPSR